MQSPQEYTDTDIAEIILSITDHARKHGYRNSQHADAPQNSIIRPKSRYPDPKYHDTVTLLQTHVRLPQPKPQEPVQELQNIIRTTVARNGQVKWHGNIKNVMEVWETAIKYHDTYARCKLQMQYAKEHKFKAFKLTFLAFLHICAIQNIVTLSFDENYNMGFVGITKITVNPATGNRFFNRLFALKEGIWHTPKFTENDEVGLLKLGTGQLNTLHNIFRKLKFSPSKPAGWFQAFQGNLDFLWCKNM